MLVRVRVFLVMLPQQIFAVIVAIRCSNYAVDMLARRLASFQMSQRNRRLMIELN
jgi:hypothetical protein